MAEGLGQAHGRYPSPKPPAANNAVPRLQQPRDDAAELKQLEDPVLVRGRRLCPTDYRRDGDNIEKTMDYCGI